MANYLVSNLHVAEFKNTNIVGDGEKWNNKTLNGDGLDNLRLKPTINVGLIGNYNTISNLYGRFQGVTDIKGNASRNIQQNVIRTGYINVWDDISRNIFGISAFSVIHIHGAGGNKVGTNVSAAQYRTFVVIYDKKYNEPLSSNVNNASPLHRAFVNSSGQIKFSNSTWETGQRKYTGSDSTKPIPFFKEEDWLDNTDPGYFATSYTDLATKESGEYVLSSLADLDTNAFPPAPPASASASPASLPTRLAAAGRQMLEAVLPAKKKSRFEEAYLA
jgi:hypothetical protein